MSRVAFFPGNTAVTDLRVYSDLADDHCHGGSPHVHLVSTEAYVVTEGRGRLRTLAPGAGVTETPLVPGTVLWFTPGVIHRLVNDGDLRIIVIMSDRGLPESGDAVLTFPSHVLDDKDAYARAATLPGPEQPEAVRAAAASARRDLAVAGFAELTAAVSEDPDALDTFYRRAAALVAHHAPGWAEVFDRTGLVAARQSRAAIDAISEGGIDHLRQATLMTAEPSPGERGFGMCGRLRTFDVTPSPAP